LILETEKPTQRRRKGLPVRYRLLENVDGTAMIITTMPEAKARTADAVGCRNAR